MIPNLYIENGWKSPFPSIYKWLALGYQVEFSPHQKHVQQASPRIVGWSSWVEKMEKSWEVLFFLRFPQKPKPKFHRFFEQSFGFGFEKNTHHPRKRMSKTSTPNPCASLLPGGHLFQGATQASWAFFRGIGGGMPKNCIDSGWIFPTRKWVVESNDPPVLEKKTAGQPGCHGKTLVLGSGKT